MQLNWSNPDYSAFARAKAFQELAEEDANWFEDIEAENQNNLDGSMKVDNILDNRIQRPESMIIPIGGVWRPDDEPVEQFFLDQPATVSSNSNTTSAQWCVLTSLCPLAPALIAQTSTEIFDSRKIYPKFLEVNLNI